MDTAIVEPMTAPPTPTPAVGEQPTNRLVADIADDAGNLLAEHANLLQAELRDGVRQTAGWAAATIVGAVLLPIGVLFALIGGVYALHENVPSLPLWACWLIVGGGGLLVGGVLAGVGGFQLSRVNLIPTRTLKSFAETWSWIVKRSK